MRLALVFANAQRLVWRAVWPNRAWLATGSLSLADYLLARLVVA